MSNSGLDAATKQLDEWLTLRPLSDNTVRSYRQSIERFLRWAKTAGQLGPLKSLEKVDLKAYLDELREGDAEGGKLAAQPLSESSVIQARRIVSAFLANLVVKGEIRASPAWSLSGISISPRNAPPAKGEGKAGSACDSMYILLGQSERLELAQSRRLIVANLAFWCSATTAEIAALEFRHLQLKRTPATVILGEGTQRMRMVVLPKHLRQLLRRYHREIEQYFENAEIERSDHLIEDLRTGQQVTGWTIWWLCKGATDSSLHGRSPQWYRTEFSRYAERQRFIPGVVPAQRGNAQWLVPRGTHSLSETDLVEMNTKLSANILRRVKGVTKTGMSRS